MKKRQTLPNFTTLYQTDRKTIWNIVSLFIFFFFLTAIGGFLWEVLIFLIKDGTLYNRGFLYGPWLPVYGIGALLFYVLLSPRKQEPRTKKQPFKFFLKTFLFSALLGTGLELLIGWQLDVLWNLHYWDYSDAFLNFRGYICLTSALGFGIAGMLWVCMLSRWFSRLWFRIPGKIRRGINTILLLLFALDCVAALIFPNVGAGITFP